MNPEEKREFLNNIWDRIDESTIPYLDNEFDAIAPKLVEFLLMSILNEDEIDIGTYAQGDTEGSCITYDVFNTDKRLELQLSSSLVFELALSICDFEGDEKNYSYLLNDIDVKIIPPGLINMMSEVAKMKKGKKVFIKSILP